MERCEKWSWKVKNWSVKVVEFYGEERVETLYLFSAYDILLSYTNRNGLNDIQLINISSINYINAATLASSIVVSRRTIGARVACSGLAGPSVH